MICLPTLIDAFGDDLLRDYAGRLLPGHLKALKAMKACRTGDSLQMLASCGECGHEAFLPHSCGHRNCPHCQHNECQQWLERQLQKQVPAGYFMVTFTLPAEFRPLAWGHQRQLYTLMFRSAWETLRGFSEKDARLQGTPGAIAVLHTHSRELGYHPHIHVVMPAAAVDRPRRQWRKKKGKYLFNQNALAKVFRAKMLAGITGEELPLPAYHPAKWVVDCKAVGSGDKALIYLGRYLYRGVIREKDILSSQDGNVTYRLRNSKTGQYETRTVAGARFLWLVLQHVLPRRFRRARNYGFLHPNSKQLIQILQSLLGFDPKRLLSLIKKKPPAICPECGAEMTILNTRLPPGTDQMEPALLL